MLERHIPGPQGRPKLMEGNTLARWELSDDKGIGPGLGARTTPAPPRFLGGDTAPVYRDPVLMEETQLLPLGSPGLWGTQVPALKVTFWFDGET